MTTQSRNKREGRYQYERFAKRGAWPSHYIRKADRVATVKIWDYTQPAAPRLVAVYDLSSDDNSIMVATPVPPNWNFSYPKTTGEVPPAWKPSI